jgi:hypothetical protein
MVRKVAAGHHPEAWPKLARAGVCLLLSRPGGRSVSPSPCAVPVVMELLAFCNGRGWGGSAHMLPVVTWRFLFSQAPALLLPMWKQGQLQPGRLQAGHPDLAQRSLRGLPPPRPRPGQWMTRFPLYQTLSFLCPTVASQRKGQGGAVAGATGQRSSGESSKLELRIYGSGLGFVLCLINVMDPL